MYCLAFTQNKQTIGIQEQYLYVVDSIHPSPYKYKFGFAATVLEASGLLVHCVCGIARSPRGPRPPHPPTPGPFGPRGALRAPPPPVPSRWQALGTLLLRPLFRLVIAS